MTNNKKSASAAATAQGTKQKVFRNENTTIPEETQVRTLWNILSDLDNCKIKFEQERDTFAIILEDLENSVNGSYFERALMDVSSLNLAYESFCGSLENYQKLIGAAYDRYHLEVPREN